MSMSRRKFLRLSALSAFSAMASGVLRLGVPTAAAQGVSDYRAAVCIFLFGGNDGNNMFIPNDDAGYQAYSTARQGLAIGRNQLLPVQTRSDARAFGFHPKLAELQSLYSQQKLAVLANVGTLIRPVTRSTYQAKSVAVPVNLFSHLDQQSQWQTSVLDDTVQPSIGWGGLTADKLQALNPGSAYPRVVSLYGSNPFCEGAQTHSAVINPSYPNGLGGIGKDTSSQTRLQGLKDLLAQDTENSLRLAASTGTANMLSELTQQTDALATVTALQTVFPTTSIGKQLSMAAKTIQARTALGLNRQIFFVGLDGFDTHTDQLTTQADLFTQLSAAMAAFYQATVEMGVASQVTSFTLSDFGRTFLPTDDGSDHGWGNHQLIMGGAVNGGDLYGRFPSLALGGADDLDERGRWIPTTSVEQYGATIASWLGINDGDLSSIFPNLANFSTSKLGFMA